MRLREGRAVWEVTWDLGAGFPLEVPMLDVRGDTGQVWHAGHPDPELIWRTVYSAPV